MNEPTPPLTPDLPPPTAGELDVLGVFWEESHDPTRTWQLNEVYRRICQRRRIFGEQEPALSTVSTHLRKLVAKGLLEETTPASGLSPNQPIRMRGGYTPPTRSPYTCYRARYTPGEVLLSTFRGLAAAYPLGQRLDALVDFARALSLPDACLKRLTDFVTEERKRSPPTGIGP